MLKKLRRLAVFITLAAGLPLAVPGPIAQAVFPPCIGPRILSIADYAANEGTDASGAGTAFTFSVTSSGCARAGGVDYASERPAGTGPYDITPVSGSLLFPSGDMSSRTITVAVSPDSTAEPNERFKVWICHGTPTAIQISRASAVGTIINDDFGPPQPLSPWERGFRCSE
jgi:hypothetical protein